ncbi:hypothetical protein BDN71DRAFT_1433390 [Pleurotus eryngii]|uniref:CxC2-like cysteine cluster KDZ transposase-associated domain-containing protein n=1 Tax=Pleurotus eryngii TaxID=5323 RepID=A0A9P6DDN3_PLEER|nr:hypothetical protein BDN71DRAFT_1433390 [Pleurotus eryngii]
MKTTSQPSRKASTKLYYKWNREKLIASAKEACQWQMWKLHEHGFFNAPENDDNYSKYEYSSEAESSTASDSEGDWECEEKDIPQTSISHTHAHGPGGYQQNPIWNLLKPCIKANTSLVFEDFPPIHALDYQLFGPVDREGLGLPMLGNMFSLDHTYLAHLANMDTDDVAVSQACKPLLSEKPISRNWHAWRAWATIHPLQCVHSARLGLRQHSAESALIQASTAFNVWLISIDVHHYIALSLDIPAANHVPTCYLLLTMALLLSTPSVFIPSAWITDQYEPFIRMMREWWHLHFLKCSGRMNDPEGPAGTGQGELALKCPVCPHPKINLPHDWEKAPPQTSRLYTLFVGIDANFRLKRKDVSSDCANPGLRRGWSYFVEEGKYQDYLKTCKEPVQKSTCNAHKAVNDADKYLVMDYLFFSSIANTPHKWLMLAPLLEREVTFLVLKFHLPAHIMVCQSSFSFNYTCGVGQTDREAPEPGWDFLNPAAGQTKEMGPGAHHELLEDLMGNRNWKKTVGIDVEKWEADPTADNPFSAVVNKLNHQEGLLLAKGELELFHEHVNPYVLISTGQDLEEQQQSLAHDTANLGMHATNRQQLMLVQNANIVRNKVNVWIDYQKLYCPSASALRTGKSNSLMDPIAAMPMINLWLPSSIGSCATCPKLLREIEWQLWHAQANDALHDICANLQIMVGVFQQKDCFKQGHPSRLVQFDLQATRWGHLPNISQRDERDGGQTNNIMDLASGWSGGDSRANCPSGVVQESSTGYVMEMKNVKYHMYKECNRKRYLKLLGSNYGSEAQNWRQAICQANGLKPEAKSKLEPHSKN